MLNSVLTSYTMVPCQPLHVVTLCAAGANTTMHELPDPDIDRAVCDAMHASVEMLNAITDSCDEFAGSECFLVRSTNGTSLQHVIIAPTGAAVCTCLDTPRTGMLCRHIIACLPDVAVIQPRATDSGACSSSRHTPVAAADSEAVVPAAGTQPLDSAAAEHDMLLHAGEEGVGAAAEHGALLERAADQPVAKLPLLGGSAACGENCENADPVQRAAAPLPPPRAQQAVVSRATAVLVFRNTQTRWLKRGVASAQAQASATGNGVLLCHVVGLAAQNYAGVAAPCTAEAASSDSTPRPATAAAMHADVWAVMKDMNSRLQQIEPTRAKALALQLHRSMCDELDGVLHKLDKRHSRPVATLKKRKHSAAAAASAGRARKAQK
jgi:hypothetical protein